MKGPVCVVVCLLLNGCVGGLKFGDNCHTPNGERGNCVRLSDCSDYSTLLASVPKPPVPTSIINHLRLAKCGTTSEMKALLCCPVNRTVNAQIKETERNSTVDITCKEKSKDEEMERLRISKDEEIEKLRISKDSEIASKDEEIKRIRSFLSLGHGYESFPQIGFYKHHKDVVDFTTASNICKSEGAHLVIINSNEEENALRDIMDKNGNGAIWTGIHDPLKNREFKTIFGTPLNETGYTKWQKGEPNNNDGNESCIDFQYNYGGLNDLNCDHKRPFICEFHI